MNVTVSQQELLKHVVNHNVDMKKLVPFGTSFFVFTSISYINIMQLLS
ncbi:hypothetical protein AAULH_07941 [Lactobacillus helveticus MTCC 5463]|nr:hypothetical protein AAULH_07941 [Lactobacillus helveticus MTCC 5463]